MMRRAAAERALPFVLVVHELGEEAEESWEDWEREGRERSVEDEEKAWLNQPEISDARGGLR
jgi:hypothetical protein